MVRSIPHLFFHSAERHAARTAFKEHGGEAKSWSYGELAEAVRETALGFATLGIHHGDRVGLFADNSIRWIQTDLALLSLGAADVPRGTDTAPAEIDYLIRHSGARVVVLQNRKVLDELAPTLADVADLQCIVLQEGSYREGDPRTVLSLDEVRERGRQRMQQGAELTPYLDRSRGSDTATIVYTSGTTGRPKGVVLSHDNILHNIRAVPSVVQFRQDDSFLSILPAWHMFERLIEYAALAKGCATVYSSKRSFKTDLLREQPSVLAAVPRLYELLYEEARRRFAESSPPVRLLIQGLVAGSIRARWARARWYGKALAPLLFAGDRLVFSKFRAALGGRLSILVSGGGSLPLHVDEFFDVAGLPLLNGYGLTETAPLVAVRRPERPELGTVGPPIPDTVVEVRGTDQQPLPDGEIGVLHVKGPQVMAGYYRDLSATRAALDPRGFFDTGDLGCKTRGGDIRITGRAKDTIVLSGGENVEPEPIENQLRLSRLVEQVVVVGQDRKQIGALIVPNREAVEKVLPALAGAREPPHAAAALPDSEEVRRLFQAEVRRLLAREHGFKPCEQVARFRLLEQPFAVERGELTETLKLKRHVIAERYRDAIEAMYRA